MAARRARAMVSEEASGLWWVLLVIGIIWLWASLVVLRFDNRSITAVGVIMGVVFLGAAVDEALIAGLSLGWRWAHWLLALVFVLAALWAFIRPEDAFWALASVLGFVLVIKGTVDIGEAVATKPVYDLWLGAARRRHPRSAVGLLGVAAVLSGACQSADPVDRVRGAVQGREGDLLGVQLAGRLCSNRDLILSAGSGPLSDPSEQHQSQRSPARRC